MDRPLFRSCERCGNDSFTIEQEKDGTPYKLHCSDCGHEIDLDK